MYDISYFKADNHQEVLDFMQANPFVTICGVNEKGLPIAAQIPILLKQIGDKIIISGHLMRKQDHTNAFEKNNNVLFFKEGKHSSTELEQFVEQTRPIVKYLYDEGFVKAKSLKVTILSK